MHAGDGLSLDFRFGPRGRMFLRARADEGAGGALAGSLGLDAKQRVTVRADVDGTETDGTLTVATQSGAVQPLVASGRWFKGGASLDARIALGASRLADRYAERLGPEVAVRLRTRQIRGDLHQVDLALAARDGKLSFLGPVDWRKRLHRRRQARRLGGRSVEMGERRPCRTGAYERQVRRRRGRLAVGRLCGRPEAGPAGLPAGARLRPVGSGLRQGRTAHQVQPRRLGRRRREPGRRHDGRGPESDRRRHPAEGRPHPGPVARRRGGRRDHQGRRGPHPARRPQHEGDRHRDQPGHHPAGRARIGRRGDDLQRGAGQALEGRLRRQGGRLRQRDRRTRSPAGAGAQP